MDYWCNPTPTRVGKNAAVSTAVIPENIMNKVATT